MTLFYDFKIRIHHFNSLRINPHYIPLELLSWTNAFLHRRLPFQSTPVRRSITTPPAPVPEHGPGDALLAQLEKARRNHLTPLKQRERYANLTRLDEDQLGFEPRCAVDTREVISAVMRADSDACKRELVEFSCKLKEGTAYPQRLPNFCPHQGEYSDSDINTLISNCRFFLELLLVF